MEAAVRPPGACCLVAAWPLELDMGRELLPFELYAGSSCLTDSHISTGSGSRSCSHSASTVHPKLAVQPRKLDMRVEMELGLRPHGNTVPQPKLYFPHMDNELG